MSAYRVIWGVNVLACYLLGLLLLSVFVSFHAHANTPVWGMVLKNRMSAEGSGGQYDAVWREMNKRGLNFELTTTPYSRQVLGFAQDPTSCLFPSSILSYRIVQPEHAHVPLIEAEGIDWVGLAVFTLPEKPVINTLADLRGKRVGMWLGFEPQSYLAGINVKTTELVSNDENMLKMLQNDRVDAIFAFEPDIRIAADKLGLQVPHKSTEFWVFGPSGSTLVCHDTPENRQFISSFNSVLNELKSNGRLREMLGPHANIVGLTARN